MNTINPVAVAQPECHSNRRASKRRWFAAFWQRAQRQPDTATAKPAVPYDPWSSAVNQVDHLDPHVLADIGAPRWVIDEVHRRQQYDGILNAGRKW